MGKFFALIFNLLGNMGAGAGTSACVRWFADEPKAPVSMIER